MPESSPSKTPFQKVTDDLTGGCGCACHTGTGYRTSCEHCSGWAGARQLIRSHQCNCIGCCRKCGTCRTWPAHTSDYCALVVRQRKEREEMVASGR